MKCEYKGCKSTDCNYYHCNFYHNNQHNAIWFCKEHYQQNKHLFKGGYR